MTYIFIHGLGQNPDSWDKTLSYMPENIRAERPDLWALTQGHDLNYHNLYQAFSAYCDNIPGQLGLCGVSLGAVLALNYTIDHPHRISSLAMIGAQYKMPAILLHIQNLIFRLMSEETFRKLGFKKADFIGLTRSMLGLNFSPSLPDISCPTLIICGSNDKANIKSSQTLAQKIPRADLQLIEQAGHQVNIDMPSELAAGLIAFLQRQNIINESPNIENGGDA